MLGVRVHRHVRVFHSNDELLELEQQDCLGLETIRHVCCISSRGEQLKEVRIYFLSGSNGYRNRPLSWCLYGCQAQAHVLT